MITQTDVENLQTQLEDLRRSLLSDRKDLKERVDGLLHQSRTMREQAAGGRFEDAIVIVCDLLTSLQAGLAAQQQLDAARPANHRQAA